MIKIGSTRIVVSWDGEVFKFGRIRPLKCVFKLLKVGFSLRARDKFFLNYGDTLWVATKHYLFAGYYANKNEYSYWVDTNDVYVNPVTNTALGGWILIQPKLATVSMNDFVANHPLPSLRKAYGMTHRKDFGTDQNGNVLIVDYGHIKTTQALLSIRDHVGV